jgi:hypothetical protein
MTTAQQLNGDNYPGSVIYGTHKADDLIGEWAGEPTSVGIINLSIYTYGGSDSVTGKAIELQGPGFGSVDGISTSTIDTGSGKDSVTAIAVNRGNGDDSSSYASSHGVEFSTLNTDDGDDTIVVTVDVTDANEHHHTGNSYFYGGNATSYSYGLVSSATIHAGEGKDSITINAKRASTGRYSSICEGHDEDSGGYASADGAGVESSIIDGDAGDDTITISGSGTGEGHFSQVVTRVNDKDKSTIDVYGSGGDGNGSDSGIVHSIVNAGDGKDKIIISSNGTGIGRFNQSVTGKSGRISGSGGSGTGNSNGVAYGSTVSGGKGDDTITISATGTGIGHLSQVIGKLSGETDGGHGQGYGYGVIFSVISAGEGNDSVTITGKGTGLSEGLGYGVASSTVFGDKGNDAINITGFGSSLGVGVADSTVDGGLGQDTIIAGGSHFGIQRAKIRGGADNDVINVGRGEGVVDGGPESDRLVIGYFVKAIKPLDISVERDAATGGLVISGQVDNLGNASLWRQTIINTEQFQVGSQIFTAAQFLKAYGA